MLYIFMFIKIFNEKKTKTKKANMLKCVFIKVFAIEFSNLLHDN